MMPVAHLVTGIIPHDTHSLISSDRALPQGCCGNTGLQACM